MGSVMTQGELAEIGWPLGKSKVPRGIELWVPFDRTVGVYGPQGSGKTLDLLTPALLSAPGAALVTLTKPEDLFLTLDTRARGQRPVHVLDPFDLAPGVPQLVWDPIDGCADSMVAERRAKAFTAGTVGGAVTRGTGDEAARFYAAEGVKVPQAYFHAAALAGASLDDVLTWLADPHNAGQPEEILRTHPGAAPFWDGLLRGAIHGDDRTAGNTITTVQQAMALFFQEAIRRRCTPGAGRPATDLKAVIEAGGTIYLLGRDDPYASASPLMTAIAEHVLDTALGMAMISEGSVSSQLFDTRVKNRFNSGMKNRFRAGALSTVLILGLLGFAAPASAAVSCDSAPYPSAQWAACEASNLAATGQNIYKHGDLLPGVARATFAYQLARIKALRADSERQPNLNFCTALVSCPVDPRVTTWEARGGLVSPVLYTSRSGATISGHVWATKAGRAKRPGVVIINGSVGGFDQAYWYLAQSLARAGFVVMSFDAQGEGMSDQLGESPDQLEDAFAGAPIVGIFGPTKVTGDVLGGNGLPFYDGGQDALDFFLSKPARPFVPRLSRSTGTSHDAKQQRRVAAGLNNGFNPLWSKIDSSKIGLTGHSYGAEASSWLSQADPRVDTAVALDSLCVPVDPSPDEADAVGAVNPDFGAPNAVYGLPRDCFGAPNGPAPAITKPALGIAGDYLLAPAPYLKPPHPLGKARASLAYTAAGVDSGQIIIRSGTHYEFSDAPGVLPATLRGIDSVAWYTQAWFRKYLLADPKADAMLLSQRWRSDGATSKVDPKRDGNLLSWHYRSRLDIHRTNGTRYVCENIRAGCAGLVAAASDGGPASYSAFPTGSAP